MWRKFDFLFFILYIDIFLSKNLLLGQVFLSIFCTCLYISQIMDFYEKLLH